MFYIQIRPPKLQTWDKELIKGTRPHTDMGKTGVVKTQKRKLEEQKNHQLIDLKGQAHRAAETRA